MSKAVNTQETQRHTDLNYGTAQWVSKNIHEIDNLPEPGIVWTSDRVGYSPGLLLKLQHERLIERVPGEGKAGGIRHFKTKPVAYDAVQTFLERREDSDRLLPCSDESCPGKGFVTTSEGLECKQCGEVHDKEAVRND